MEARFDQVYKKVGTLQCRILVSDNIQLHQITIR